MVDPNGTFARDHDTLEYWEAKVINNNFLYRKKNYYKQRYNSIFIQVLFFSNNLWSVAVFDLIPKCNYFYFVKLIKELTIAVISLRKFYFIKFNSNLFYFFLKKYFYCLFFILSNDLCLYFWKFLCLCACVCIKIDLSKRMFLAANI